MTFSVKMKLVFRLGGIGFALEVGDLEEVREGHEALIDLSAAEPSQMICGSLNHRGAQIPVRDLAGCLKLPAPRDDASPVILILAGTDGPWSVRVDAVTGVFPEAQFAPRELPLLLREPAPLPYSQLLLWRDEPLVRCELHALERCWGAS